MNRCHRCHRRQRGATLVEALVAFLVLSLGILIVSRVHAHLRLHADIARQRAEAVRLAQQDIEAFRSFAVLHGVASAPSYDALGSLTQALVLPAGHAANTDYTLDRRVDGAAGFKSARVAVQWNDTAGEPQHATLDTVVARADPALAAALTVPHPALRGAFGRAPFIPLEAKDLGDGRSVFKPNESGTVAWVFDNATGVLTAECTLATTLFTQHIAAADLAACAAATGVVLDGAVRFAAGIPPLPLTVELAMTGNGYPAPPRCWSELRKVVIVAGSSRARSVAAHATPSVLGAAAWHETGERFMAYHCMVAPHQGRWSGRSEVLPQGWTLGTAAGEYRVCRYSADHDGSGAVDSNDEHPARYVDVSGALAQQNFLVVAGPDACPVSPGRGSGGAAPLFADAGTVQHQP